LYTADGYFEVVKPPNPKDEAENLTDAIAESFEAAMGRENDYQ
jgi:hypothetical protein